MCVGGMNVHEIQTRSSPCSWTAMSTDAGLLTDTHEQNIPKTTHFSLLLHKRKR